MVDDYEDTGKQPEPGPVTIWIGVSLATTSASIAHDAAQDILTLLAKNRLTDIDVDFRGSIYTRAGGPALMPPASRADSPLVRFVRPLTPGLGLFISARDMPDVQGTMTLYLEEGGQGLNSRLLGVTSRHTIVCPKEPNTTVTAQSSAPPRDVVLLSDCRLDQVIQSIEVSLLSARRDVYHCEQNIKERSSASNAAHAETKKARAEKEILALETLLADINRDWMSIDQRVLGHLLHSPPIRLGVGKEQFTEDWAVFEIDRTKLGPGFQGNALDLGNMSEMTVMKKCRSGKGEDWEFDYPFDDELFALRDFLPVHLMRQPDAHDQRTGEPSLLVIKSGSTTGTTFGRANGVFSLVREYSDTDVWQMSRQWAIMSFGDLGFLPLPDDESGAFAALGDSGAIIADTKGRIGGMLTGGSCKVNAPNSREEQELDLVYSTPFEWVLERIKADAFPDAHLDIKIDVQGAPSRA